MNGGFELQAANIIATLGKAAVEARLAQEQKTELGKAIALQPHFDTDAYQEATLIWSCLQDLEEVLEFVNLLCLLFMSTCSQYHQVNAESLHSRQPYRGGA